MSAPDERGVVADDGAACTVFDSEEYDQVERVELRQNASPTRAA
jgi:hypothetical protein